MGLAICKRLPGAGFQVRVLCRNGASASIATTNGFEVARAISETAKGADVVAPVPSAK
jgi:3-hydroxyisobutyrate dehydrogenase-like beta-hydroxyacid dehydrogenase